MRDPNKKYTTDAFKQLCEQTLQNLPEKVNDKSVSKEKRHELALEQLLNNVQKYANTSSIKLGLPDMPKTSYLETQIIHVLEHDWSLSNFNNKAVIHNFVTEALDEKEN